MQNDDTELAAAMLNFSPGWSQCECDSCGKVFRYPLGIHRGVEARIGRSIGGSLCDACDGSREAIQLALQAETREATHESSGIPRGVERRSLHPILRDFLKDDEKHVLLLSGELASGKTTQLVNLVREFVKKTSRSAIYRSETTMLRNLRNFDDKHWPAWREMRALSETALVCIDDVGTGHAGQDGAWVASQYIELIDQRFRTKKTVIATNLPFSELWALSYIDDRVRRRLEGVSFVLNRRAERDR